MTLISVGVDFTAFKTLLDANELKFEPCTSGGAAIVLPLTNGILDVVLCDDRKKKTARLGIQSSVPTLTQSFTPGLPVKEEAFSNVDNDHLRCKVQKRALETIELEAELVALDLKYTKLKELKEINVKRCAIISDYNSSSTREFHLEVVIFF